MGWIEDTGLHEAYLRPETPDGPHEHAAGDRVIGWRLHCECHSPDSPPTPVGHWASQLWTRVPTPALENLEAGQIYATDQQATHLDDRDDIAALVHRIWHTDHLDIPAALEAITTARHTLDHATTSLDQAVAAARTAGASWDAIGHAAGMTRQSAHQRWNNPRTQPSRIAPAQ